MSREDIQKASDWLKDADAVLVTASNGLSIAEGYHIFADNEAFQKYFGEFREKYQLRGLIYGVFAQMSGTDHDRYMEKVHTYLIDDYKGSEVFENLKKLLGNKAYFVVTSNADTHFQINGFDPKRIFEVEGNFDGLQEGSSDWEEQRKNFTDFINAYASKKTVLLELGIGARNQLIKAPTMQMAEQCPSWHYITLNLPQEILIPADLQERALALTGDIGGTFKALNETMHQ
jgi:hypothetical protein